MCLLVGARFLPLLAVEDLLARGFGQLGRVDDRARLRLRSGHLRSMLQGTAADRRLLLLLVGGGVAPRAHQILQQLLLLLK